ncbi:MAG TPA: HIT family protein [Mycobacteriales bacterium]
MTHAPPDYECPFCGYAAGVGNEYGGHREHVVERTPTTLAFVSPRWWPGCPGHVIVVPTAHYENLYEVPDAVGGDLFAAARRAALALKAAYGCPGTSTRQHNEPAGDQEVWHFHWHVFPRWPGDRLYETGGEWAAHDAMAERAVLLRAAYARLG